MSRKDLKARGGTGCYTAASLLCVWYCGHFEHNGLAATREDWVKPARTYDTIVSTCWKVPPDTKPRRGEEARVRANDEYQSGKKPEIKSRIAANLVGWEKDHALFDRELEKVIRPPKTDDAGREKPPPSKL